MPHGRGLINASLLPLFPVSDREPWWAEEAVASSELCGEGFEGREAANRLSYSRLETMVHRGSEQNLREGGDGGREGVSRRRDDPDWERRLREGQMDNATDFPCGVLRWGWG